jgi:hypothetical protein
MAILLELGNRILVHREYKMPTEPCSPINKPPGEPKGKGRPLPKPPKPESPGACSNPSLGK